MQYAFKPCNVIDQNHIKVATLMSSSLTEVGRPGRDQFVFIGDTVTMD